MADTSSTDFTLVSRGTLPELRMVGSWSDIDGSIDVFLSLIHI